MVTLHFCLTTSVVKAVEELRGLKTQRGDGVGLTSSSNVAKYACLTLPTDNMHCPHITAYCI
jgi:hypothetical protein